MTEAEARCESASQSIERLKQEGNLAFLEGNAESAARSYGEALSLTSQDDALVPVLLSNRSGALTQLGEFERALKDADDAAKRMPDWPKAHFRRGAALYGLRRFAEALEAYDAGLNIEPNNEALLQGRAMVLDTLHQLEAAVHPDSRSPLDLALATLAAAGVTRQLPVLIVSGFLGSGKTTLLNRVLSNCEGLRVAVLVNDMAEVNVDAELLAAGRAGVSRREEKLVTLTNGCICCTLRDDLLAEVTRLVAQGSFDYLLVEGTGIAEPLPVAATFSAVGSAGSSLLRYAPLDSMLTVVDASRLSADFASGDLLRTRGMAAAEMDGRSVAGLIAEQIEFADALLLNKCDLVTVAEREHLLQALRALNPRARILTAVRCDVPISDILNTGRFSLAQASQADGWDKELEAASGGTSEHTPETEAYAISSVTFRRRRPFHPQRLWDQVMGAKLYTKLLRSKGFFWLASRNGVAWQWSTSGRSAEFGPAGQWRADAVPRELWPADDPGWDPLWGDRQTTLVLIGQGSAPRDVAASLEECLLTDLEMAAGESAWDRMGDSWSHNLELLSVPSTDDVGQSG